MPTMLLAAAVAALALNPSPARADEVVDPAGRVYFTTGQDHQDLFVRTGADVDALVRAGPRGRLATVAVFPPRWVPFPHGIPFGPPPGTPVLMRTVPDSVVRGPDGAFYVGERTGFPFPPGEARVWRVVPGHPPTVYARGYTRIVGLSWGTDGRLLVRELRSGR